MHFQFNIISFIRVNLVLNTQCYNRPHSPEFPTPAEPQLTSLCVHSDNWTWGASSAPATCDTYSFGTTSNRWVWRQMTISMHTAPHRTKHSLN